jgi:hypothetical protein
MINPKNYQPTLQKHIDAGTFLNVSMHFIKGFAQISYMKTILSLFDYNIINVNLHSVSQQLVKDQIHSPLKSSTGIF